MPKNYNDIYKSVFETGNKMDFTNSIIRGNGIPLDIYSVFNSFEAAVDYAANKAVAYEGQILAVTENGDTTVYVITPASQGTTTINDVETTIYLKKVGTVPVGDGQSIEIVDGAIKLNGFNDHYYAYSVEEDGTSKYTKTEGFKEGLEPKVIKRLDENGSVVTDTEGNPLYEIAWYEPSTTTVEGLNSTVETLSKSVASKADKATTLAGYGITDAYTKDETANLIASAGHLKRAVVTDLPEASAADAETIYMVKVEGVEGDAYKEYMLIDGALVQIGDTSVSLDGYVTDDALTELLNGKVDKNGTDRLITEEEAAIIEKLKNLTGNEQVNVIDGVSGEFVISEDGKILSVKEIEQSKIKGLAETLAGYENVVKSVDTDELTIDENGKLTIKKVANEKVDGLADLFAGKVDKVDGSRLMTDAEGTKLDGIEDGAEVNIIEIVKLGDEELEVTDKTVKIPVGGETLGVVKSATGDNKVTVATDGTMSVATVNANTLTQTEGETLILNGGSASTGGTSEG